MSEKTLQKLLKGAEKIREISGSSYYNDEFRALSNFILKKLSSVFKNRNAKIIANHFDEILPYIVSSNCNILLLHAKLLIKQPGFKEKFIEGLKKYPYKDELANLFRQIWACLYDDLSEFDNFVGDEILETVSTMSLSRMFYQELLNIVSENDQKKLLLLLASHKCNIPYSGIQYKGNNEQIIYNNLSLFIENACNLYGLMNFVKDNQDALSQVKSYIDSNEEKAITSLFYELVNITEPTLKEIIRLIVLEVMENENASFSDITVSSGGFSRVLLIGDKVVKLGHRRTKTFPNNPYIVTPLLRKELKINEETCFIEVTERVDTSIMPSKEELYQLFKSLRDLGLKWTDIKPSNVGRLRRKNIIHWKEDLRPTEEALELDAKRGEAILEEGNLVILDADFIYDENDPNITYSDKRALYDEFERRYQMEKKASQTPQENSNLCAIINHDIDGPKGKRI